MPQIPESSKSRKRLRQEEEEEIRAETSDADQTLSLEESLIFSDTLMALRIIRAQFPSIDKVSIRPFILRSQLYSCVKDRTQVDRELESLLREKVLRIFKLNTGQDDHAIMFLDDYLSQGFSCKRALMLEEIDWICGFEIKTHNVKERSMKRRRFTFD
uniref:Uncharacterized protein n=1 Tax=Manihot esculenta TaxID=3983 RepID=A0A2C9UTC0_MANES